MKNNYISGVINKDFIIASRNYFFVLAAALAVIYILIIQFIIPEEISFDPDFYVVDNTKERIMESLIEKNPEKIHLVNDGKEKLLSILEKEKYSVGVIVEDVDSSSGTKIIFQGYEDPKIQQILTAALQKDISGKYVQKNIEINKEILREGVSFEKPPFNVFLLPTFLYSEIIMIGLFFVALLIFFEKEEGTIYAYMVTGRNVNWFLLSKGIVLALLAVFFTFLLVIPVMGISINWGILIFLVILGSFFASFTGIILASLFTNFSRFIYPAMGAIALLTMPAVSYMFPSFSPLWLKWFPTYSLIFAFREVFYPSGRTVTILIAAVFLLIINILLFAVGSKIFKNKLYSDRA
jgi:hypothetical protein